MPIDNSLAALRENIKEAVEYTEFLERELVDARRQLLRAVRNRKQFDGTSNGNSPVHTGLTKRVRALLILQGPLTRQQIEDILNAEKVPFTRKRLGVMLAQNFVYVKPTYGKGAWTVPGPEADILTQVGEPVATVPL